MFAFAPAISCGVADLATVVAFGPHRTVEVPDVRGSWRPGNCGWQWSDALHLAESDPIWQLLAVHEKVLLLGSSWFMVFPIPIESAIWSLLFPYSTNPSLSGFQAAMHFSAEFPEQDLEKHQGLPRTRGRPLASLSDELSRRQ